jgi:hypothetical protein
MTALKSIFSMRQVGSPRGYDPETCKKQMIAYVKLEAPIERHFIPDPTRLSNPSGDF